MNAHVEIARASAALVSLLLAACGNEGGQADRSQTPPNDAGPAPASADPGGSDSGGNAGSGEGPAGDGAAAGAPDSGGNATSGGSSSGGSPSGGGHSGGSGGLEAPGSGGAGGGGSHSIPNDFDLEKFREVSSLDALNYVPADLSGITYNPDRQSFYMIRNNLTRVWEVNLEYQLVRTMAPTSKFGDTEDIVYLGNNEVAIVTEEGVLYIGTLPDGEADITFDPDEFQAITFAPDGGAVGPEGVAFDANTSTFYVVKEENPRKLYSFKRPGPGVSSVTSTEPYDAQTLPMPRLTQDMSGVLFNPVTGRLLILSHRDHRVVDIDLTGKVFGVLDLPRAQHEGISFDDRGQLHIVAEPNLSSIYAAP